MTQDSHIYFGACTAGRLISRNDGTSGSCLSTSERHPTNKTRFSGAVLACGAMCGAWGIAQVGQSRSESIAAREFLVIDKDGTPRMRMCTNDAGSPEIELYNDKGGLVAVLSSNGNAGTLALGGPSNGSIRLSTRPIPAVEITDRVGRSRAQVSLEDGYSPLVKLVSSDGRSSMHMRIDPLGAEGDAACEFALNREVSSGEQGSPPLDVSRMRCVARTSGGTDIEVSGKNDEPVLRIAVTGDGKPQFYCSDAVRDVLRRVLGL